MCRNGHDDFSHEGGSRYGHDERPATHLQDGHQLSDDKRHRHKQRGQCHAWKRKYDLQPKRLEVWCEDASSAIEQHEHEARYDWRDGKWQVKEREYKCLARKVIACELQGCNHPKDGVDGDCNGCQCNGQFDLWA